MDNSDPVVKPVITFTHHEQHVHTYQCDQCSRPIRYVIHQYRLGNGKFMPATANIPPQCEICGSTPKDFVATMNVSVSTMTGIDHQPSASSFNINAPLSVSSMGSLGPRSAEILVERAEAVGPGGTRMLDMASYTTCMTHFDTNNLDDLDNLGKDNKLYIKKN